MAALEEGIIATLNKAEEFFGDQAMKLLLVTLQELGGSEVPVASWDIACVRSGCCVDELMAFEGT